MMFHPILIYRCTILVLFIVCQAAIGPGPVFISDRVGKGSLIDMAFLVDSSPKFRVLSIGIRGYQGGTFILFLGLSGTMIAMLVGLVNGGILLLIVVSLVGEMPGLVGGHGGHGPGIMWHINRFFHHSRIGPPIVGPIAIGWGWATKHGLSIGWHSIEGVARGWHQMRWGWAIHHHCLGWGVALVLVLFAPAREGARFHGWGHTVAPGWAVPIHHGPGQAHE